MQKKYLIYCGSYSPIIGGHIVLHKMCDLINSLGGEAYMCPYRQEVYKETATKTIFYRLIHPFKTLRYLLGACYTVYKYKTNPEWDTPVINPFKVVFGFTMNDHIVLYPEIVNGNPIGAKYVTRLLMHNPGHFYGKIEFGENDLLFRYSQTFGRDFKPTSNCVLSDSFITISTTPSCYYPPKDNTPRKGVAYCLRKGKGKKIVHDMTDAILIDDMSHEEVAEVFRKVEVFVSYDSLTAFSRFALQCHCPSVKILSEGETPETCSTTQEIAEKFCYDMNYKEFNWEDSFKWAERICYERIESSKRNAMNYIRESQDFFMNK